MIQTRKNKSGVSLITLIITVIVLAILAGAVIIQLSNTNIISQTREATLKNAHSTVKETIVATYSDYMMEKYLVKSTELAFFDYLYEKGYIKDYATGTIDVVTLLGSEQSIGNGNADTNVYMLEVEGTNYVLNYYDEDYNVTNLGAIFPAEDSVEAPPEPTISTVATTIKSTGENIVEITLSNITETECPIYVAYYVLPDGYMTLHANGETEVSYDQVTNGSVTLTFKHSSDDLTGVLYIGVTDGLGNYSTVMCENEETGELENYNGQIRVTAIPAPDIVATSSNYSTTLSITNIDDLHLPMTIDYYFMPDEVAEDEPEEYLVGTTEITADDVTDGTYTDTFDYSSAFGEYGAGYARITATNASGEGYVIKKDDGSVLQTTDIYFE